MSRPVLYEIRIAGQLDGRWSSWFDGLEVCQQAGGETALVGPLADQAALYGILHKIRDLGLALISVRRLDVRPPG